MSFVAYLGDPDFHDGTILDVAQEGDSVRVFVRGYSGRRFTVEFHGVQSVEAVQPVGMRLYALSEVSEALPVRRFVFVNSFDAEKEPRAGSRLEIRAHKVAISESLTTNN